MDELTGRFGRATSAAFICAALVLLVVGAFGLASSIYAQTSTGLAGQVFNGTTEAPPERVANLDVTLFQMGAGGPVTQTVQTDQNGRFTFSDLKLDPSSPYFAQVEYEGIQYFSEIATPGVQTSIPLSLTVYETETVPSDYVIDRTHFILDVVQNALTGIELVQVKNPTDRAFVLPLPLPQNISDIQFNDPRDQFRAIQAADGSISFPILPTTDQILLGVRLTTSPPNYTLKLRMPVRVGQVNVLISQTGGVQASSSQLAAGPVFTPQGGASYWQLSGSNIPAGSTVPVVVSNLPGGDNSTLARGVVLGLGGVAVVILLAVPFVRRRRAPSLPSFVSDVEGVQTSNRLARLKAIADLDDAFEGGEIPVDEYHSQRASLKSELMNDPDAQT